MTLGANSEPQDEPWPNREQRRATGFRGGRRIYKLRFEQPEMFGLVVRAHSIPVARVLELARAGVLGEQMEITPENLALVQDLFATFGDALVEWNLEEDDGTPVPATAEGVLSQDMDFVMLVVQAWLTGIMGVSAPLGGGSTSGAPFPEASIPMAPLSPNPQS
jgi:hypothetical protein